MKGGNELSSSFEQNWRGVDSWTSKVNSMSHTQCTLCSCSRGSSVHLFIPSIQQVTLCGSQLGVEQKWSSE